MVATVRSRSLWPALLVLSSAVLCAHGPARAHGDKDHAAPAGLVPIAPTEGADNGAGKQGTNVFDTTAPNGGVPANLAKLVGIDQKLDDKVPENLSFKDETGKTVKLADYFGKKPVLLTMLQLKCDLVCSAQLEAMNASFREQAFGFTPGQEFEVLTVSIDPTEGPLIAQDAHDEQIKALENPAAKDGWHFLTGDEKSTKALAKSLGIKYIWDASSKQFIHPDGIVMATPDGHISRYFMNLNYQPRDMRYSIIEASKDRVGTVLDQIALSCFHYNPSTGKYSFQIMALLRLVGGAFVLGCVAAIGLAVVREKRGGKNSGAGATASGTESKIKTA